MTPPSPFRVQQALAVARELRARLEADGVDLAQDEELLLGTLDGETDALDVVRRLVRHSTAMGAMADAAGGRIEALTARRARFQARAEASRRAALEMLGALGAPRVDDAEFTATVRQGSPGVVVTDEAALPDRFVRTKRTPDKAAIGAALRAGQDVPGAMLKNSAPSLQVRTS